MALNHQNVHITTICNIDTLEKDNTMYQLITQLKFELIAEVDCTKTMKYCISCPNNYCWNTSKL